MSATKDKYDLAIEYLTENPNEIVIAWQGSTMHCAGHLFAFATPTRHYRFDGVTCGCLTQIRGGDKVACNEQLTRAIESDTRIPDNEADITVETLPIFAEWQRRIDKELGRV